MASTSPQMVKCWVDGKVFPKALTNEHHVHPQEAGGADVQENLVDLCPTCHQTLHRLSEMYLKGKMGQAKDFAAIIFPTDVAARERILHLTSEAARHLQEFREITPKAALAETSVTIEFDSFDYARLQSLARDYKTPDGRRGTVPAYIRALVLRHLRNPARPV